MASSTTALRLGSVVPDFEADTTQGRIKFHEYINGSWAILFSHPADHTPVCTTELGTAASREAEFTARGVKLLALSCDSVESHKDWEKDIESVMGVKPAYPIIADTDRTIAVAFNMLDLELKDAAGLPVTVRSVFVVGPDKKIKLTLTYPPAVGRNFDEILRVVDALQVNATHPVATPANWVRGDKVMVLPNVPADVASAMPGFETTEVPSGKPYIRTANDPLAKADATASASGAAEAASEKK